ncbi:unnamed protein product [Trifolium pratense]|uniref:Uncharacterized protein n=1 Tax=Trifolium pratense TaxID=57577 RepID=A0ACB0IKL4_TRIPR|nr:unnamed protein product [Trifolium pratense]
MFQSLPLQKISHPTTHFLTHLLEISFLPLVKKFGKHIPKLFLKAKKIRKTRSEFFDQGQKWNFQGYGEKVGRWDEKFSVQKRITSQGQKRKFRDKKETRGMSYGAFIQFNLHMQFKYACFWIMFQSLPLHVSPTGILVDLGNCSIF